MKECNTMRKFTNNDENKVRSKFESFKNGKISSEDTQKVINNLDSIQNMAKKGALASLFDDISTLCEMVKAWSSGVYKQIPKKTIVMILLTLLYVCSPIDLIPDFIPIIGCVDDAMMVSLCIAAAKSDIEEFRRWKIS